MSAPLGPPPLRRYGDPVPGAPVNRRGGRGRTALLFAASVLIGLWAALQLVYTFVGPAFGAVAWSAHLAGFAFGGAFGLFARAGIARRLRRRQGF